MRSFQLKAVVAGLLAPAAFKVEDKQYAVAVHASTGAYVSNGSIPDVAAAPAVPGETLTFYGTGFGPVTPAVLAGRVVTGLASITNSSESTLSRLLGTAM